MNARARRAFYRKDCLQVFSSFGAGDNTCMREAQLEGYFVSACRREGWKAIKLMPSEKGVPDRMVIIPGGEILLVELKTETGRLSPAQREWHRRAGVLGVHVYVVKGPKEVKQWIESIKQSNGLGPV